MKYYILQKFEVDKEEVWVEVSTCYDEEIAKGIIRGLHKQGKCVKLIYGEEL